jgi:hypothetical protein
MNWGWKLAVVYLLFMAGILTLVFKARGQKVDLVSADYYKQELAYTERMDAMSNANHLSNDIIVLQSDEVVLVEFPQECIGKDVKGTITMYCPSDSNQDAMESIKLSANGQHAFEVSQLKNGLYMVKVSWIMDGKNYYKEQAITLH